MMQNSKSKKIIEKKIKISNKKVFDLLIKKASKPLPLKKKTKE